MNSPKTKIAAKLLHPQPRLRKKKIYIQVISGKNVLSDSTYKNTLKT